MVNLSLRVSDRREPLITPTIPFDRRAGFYHGFPGLIAQIAWAEECGVGMPMYWRRWPRAAEDRYSVWLLFDRRRFSGGLRPWIFGGLRPCIKGHAALGPSGGVNSLLNFATTLSTTPQM